MSHTSLKQQYIMIPILLILLAGLTYSADAAAGVGPNQQLQYKATRTNLNGNDTELMDQITEQTYWINVTVISIEGNLLTLRAISYNQTSMSSNSTMLLNCATGESTPTGAQRLFIPASRNAGDGIHLEYPDNKTFILNQTLVTNYLGTPLLTNLLSYDENATNVNYVTVTTNLTANWQFLWDQQTGTLVEFNYTIHTSRTIQNGDSLILTQNLNLIILSATPMIPELNSPAIILLVATTAVAAVIVASKTKKSSQRQRKPGERQ
jgi:hypothetical protein